LILMMMTLFFRPSNTSSMQQVPFALHGAPAVPWVGWALARTLTADKKSDQTD
jgi:hypothetical protein